MINFEIEINKLRKWLNDKTDAWMKSKSELMYDCDADKIQHENILEYNRRLEIIKTKYGIE